MTMSLRLASVAASVAAVVAIYVNKPHPVPLDVMEVHAAEPLTEAIQKCELLGNSKAFDVSCKYEDASGVPAFTMTRLNQRAPLSVLDAVTTDVVDALCADGLVYVKIVDVVALDVIRFYGTTCDHGKVETITGITTIFFE